MTTAPVLDGTAQLLMLAGTAQLQVWAGMAQLQLLLWLASLQLLLWLASLQLLTVPLGAARSAMQSHTCRVPQPLQPLLQLLLSMHTAAALPPLPCTSRAGRHPRH